MCDISEEEQLEYLRWKEAEGARSEELRLRTSAEWRRSGRVPVLPPEPALA